jgi:hypothetical protein
MGLSDASVVLTGATTGIGRATALWLDDLQLRTSPVRGLDGVRALQGRAAGLLVLAGAPAEVVSMHPGVIATG